MSLAPSTRNSIGSILVGTDCFAKAIRGPLPPIGGCAGWVTGGDLIFFAPATDRLEAGKMRVRIYGAVRVNMNVAANDSGRGYPASIPPKQGLGK